MHARSLAANHNPGGATSDPPPAPPPLASRRTSARSPPRRPDRRSPAIAGNRAASGRPPPAGSAASKSISTDSGSATTARAADGPRPSHPRTASGRRPPRGSSSARGGHEPGPRRFGRRPGQRTEGRRSHRIAERPGRGRPREPAGIASGRGSRLDAIPSPADRRAASRAETPDSRGSTHKPPRPPARPIAVSSQGRPGRSSCGPGPVMDGRSSVRYAVDRRRPRRASLRFRIGSIDRSRAGGSPAWPRTGTLRSGGGSGRGRTGGDGSRPGPQGPASAGSGPQGEPVEPTPRLRPNSVAGARTAARMRHRSSEHRSLPPSARVPGHRSPATLRQRSGRPGLNSAVPGGPGRRDPEVVEGSAPRRSVATRHGFVPPGQGDGRHGPERLDETSGQAGRPAPGLVRGEGQFEQTRRDQDRQHRWSRPGRIDVIAAPDGSPNNAIESDPARIASASIGRPPIASRGPEEGEARPAIRATSKPGSVRARG